MNTKLTNDQKRVLFEKATEPPFSGALLEEHRTGTFICANCGQSLFSSEAKFDSGSGWPSFDKALDGAMQFTEDLSHSMRRIEIACSNCSGHLGHLFPDGPTPTGQRFCVNSLALSFTQT